MVKISAVIITLNEDRHLERCLSSLEGVVDEMVVVDSLSTDRTVETAQRYGAKIVLQPFLGYVEQHTFADNQAANDWILSIDADEALSEKLRTSILAFKQEKPLVHAYSIARLNNYCGQWIRHGGWYPDRKTRLFNRTQGSWQGVNVHESWKPNNNTAIGRLTGDLLHYTYQSIAEHINKQQKYADLSARGAAMQGKSSSISKIVLGPFWVFIKTYFFKMGFLDGYYGYLISRYAAYYTFMKYSKTREYAAALRRTNTM